MPKTWYGLDMTRRESLLLAAASNLVLVIVGVISLLDLQKLGVRARELGMI